MDFYNERDIGYIIKNKFNPVVKWAGGKTQLLETILRNIPLDYNNYYEPFLGGGALLFALKPTTAYANDTNKELINVYCQIKENFYLLDREMDKLDSKKVDKEFYLKIRDRYNLNEKLDIEKAVDFIWLNKHCFNGLYRVNKKGKFNVPYNNKGNIKSLDTENASRIYCYLNQYCVNFDTLDFEDFCRVQEFKDKDFIYFDSPYIPVNATSNFVDYQKDGFAYNDHIRLANLFKRLTNKNVYVMLSNNDTELARKLYKDFHIIELEAKRNINSNGNKRKGKELIIMNY